MRLLRFFTNLVLALVIIGLALAVLAVGFGYIVVDTWEYDAPVLAERQGSWLQVNGQPVHLTTAGPETGPAMVLLHGSDIEGGLTFSSNIKALGASGLRVIALDFPGYGYSTRDTSLGYMAADQVRLLDVVLTTLDAKQVTLVGFERGCKIVLGYALEQSQNVKQIALISPSVYQDSRPLPNWLASMPVVGRSLLWIRDASPLLTMLRGTGFANPAGFTNAMRDVVVSTSHITGTNAFQLTWLRDTRSDSITAIADVADLRMPVLILSGSLVKGTTTREASRLADVLSDARLVEIPGAGYYVHQDAAEDVNQRLIQLGLHGIR